MIHFLRRSFRPYDLNILNKKNFLKPCFNINTNLNSVRCNANLPSKESFIKKIKFNELVFLHEYSIYNIYNIISNFIFKNTTLLFFDKNFDEKNFLDNSKKAIVVACDLIANKDKENLKPLLTKTAYEQACNLIDNLDNKVEEILLNLDENQLVRNLVLVYSDKIIDNKPHLEIMVSCLKADDLDYETNRWNDITKISLFIFNFIRDYSEPNKDWLINKIVFAKNYEFIE